MDFLIIPTFNVKEHIVGVGLFTPCLQKFAYRCFELFTYKMQGKRLKWINYLLFINMILQTL